MSLLTSSGVQELVSRVRGNGNFENAWGGYRELVLELARKSSAPRLLEVGGGRFPMLTQQEIESANIDYTVNDIDSQELAKAPEWVKQLHGDIADPKLLDAAEHAGSYDFIFSQMVFEHVEHPEEGYRNIARLLAPGGIVVNFVPTLYALPFVLNLLLPERLAAAILGFFFPNRNAHEIPKFPAYYRWTTSTTRTQKRLDSVGFRRTQIVPFYGHGYYDKLPGLRSFVSRVARSAARRDIRAVSTYAYILGER